MYFTVDMQHFSLLCWVLTGIMG